MTERCSLKEAGTIDSSQLVLSEAAKWKTPPAKHESSLIVKVFVVQ